MKYYLIIFFISILFKLVDKYVPILLLSIICLHSYSFIENDQINKIN